MNNKDLSIDEILGNKATEQRDSTAIDLTAGKINPPVGETGVHVDVDVKPDNTTTRRRVVPVYTGPVDTTNIRPVNTQKILPRKTSEPSKYEDQLMTELDFAIEREKESISKRINDITEMQIQEQEEAEEADIEAREEDELFDSVREDYNMTSFDNTNGNDIDDEYYNDSVYDTRNNRIVQTVSFEDCDDISGLSDDSNIERVSDVYEYHETINEEPNNTIELSSVHNDHEYKEANNIDVDIRQVGSDDISKDLNLYEDEEIAEDVSNTETSSEEDTDKIIEDLKNQIKSKTSDIKKSFDISKFKINKKSIDAQKVMKMAIRSHQTIADWIMYDAGRPISMTGLSGPEILKLDPSNSNRNRLNTFRDIYRIIYDHVYDGNKPEFETWLKQTKFSDVDHIYFALFMATFGNNNFFHYECPKCKKVFIKDIAKIEDMIVYSDDATKARVREILRKDTTSPSNDEYPVDIVQISDKYAFGIHNPSIWNVIIETATLSDNFIEKYSDLIDVITYIDTIYFIDAENENLIPISYKIDANDHAKTVARRIKSFYDIISSLNSDEYFKLTSSIAEYRKETSDKVSYIIPGATCPECLTEIPANEDITPEAMVFMRHQLAAIGNI